MVTRGRSRGQTCWRKVVLKHTHTYIHARTHHGPSCWAWHPCSHHARPKATLPTGCSKQWMESGMDAQACSFLTELGLLRQQPQFEESPGVEPAQSSGCWAAARLSFPTTLTGVRPVLGLKAVPTFSAHPPLQPVPSHRHIPQ